jgi:hypothetical protein
MLGRFLELSVRAGSVLESWGFYERLGFTTATVHDVWPHAYTALTDGRVAIGLHERLDCGAALSFVKPELAQHVAQLESAGVALSQHHLSEGRFHHVTFEANDTLSIQLVEARTYSPIATRSPTLLGWFEECALAVDSLDEACAYWESLGYVLVPSEESRWPARVLTSDTLNIGLFEKPRGWGPTLVFSTEDLQATHRAIVAAGLEASLAPTKPLDAEHFLALIAPEGTRLLVTNRAL